MAKRIKSTRSKVIGWTFLIALGLLPFPVLEWVLTLSDYGFDASFVEEQEHGGTDRIVENREFTKRFFPPHLAPFIEPFTLERDKSSDTIRIFVLGASAAQGDPVPPYSFARILQILLEEAFPKRSFEVINTAVVAINSHVLYAIAQDLADLQPDCFIVYVGNNEVIGPFGPGTVFAPFTDRLGTIRFSNALRTTRVGQLASSFSGGAGESENTPAHWAGMKMFEKHRIAHSDSRLKKVYAHFEQNLKDIAQEALQRRAPVILSNVAVNLKDSPPFHSFHAPELSADLLKQWNESVDAGKNSLRANQPDAALAHFAKALQIDDDYAELHYLIGKCKTASGDLTGAKEAFHRARDLDGLRFRADSAINRIVEEIARSNTDIHFCDVVQDAQKASLNGIVGNELLLEHVHFNFTGNYVVAKSLFYKLVEILPSLKQKGNHPVEVADLKECESRLAFSDWDKLQLDRKLLDRISESPFTEQYGHKNVVAKLQQRIAAQKADMGALIGRSLEMYRNSLSRSPDDWIMRNRYGMLLLQGANQPKKAAKQFTQVLKYDPDNFTAISNMGVCYAYQGKFQKALPWFEKGLAIQPYKMNLHNGYAATLWELGEKERSLNWLKKAQSMDPTNPKTLLQLSDRYKSKGKLDRAVYWVEKAIEADKTSATAHFELARLMLDQKNQSRALGLFKKAHELDPRNPEILNHLAMTCYFLGQRDESIHYLEKAVTFDPRNPDLRVNLASMLTAKGALQQAIAQYQHVANSHPNYPNIQQILQQATQSAQPATTDGKSVPQ